MRTAMQAKPKAGKMYALLPWPGTKVNSLPSLSVSVTGSKGEPDANTAAPFVQAYLSKHEPCADTVPNL
jgi:hypothetical protein